MKVTNINQIILILRNIEKLKLDAANRISIFFKIDNKDIFYEYIKNNIPSDGVLNDGTNFNFHGLILPRKSGHFKKGVKSFLFA